SLRTPQRRTHLVHVQLHDRALLALLRLERTRLQPALHNHPRAPSQRLRNVLTLLTPRRTPEEQRLPIPELVGLPVEYAWRARHREVRNRRTIRREPHLRISRQIPYHRDHCFAAHALPAFFLPPAAFSASSFLIRVTFGFLALSFATSIFTAGSDMNSSHSSTASSFSASSFAHSFRSRSVVPNGTSTH